MALTQVQGAMVGPTGFANLSGVTFPATQVPSADANTLDDYEEGTFSPTLFAGSGSITSYTASGVYTKVGRLVTIAINYTITNNGTGGSNANFGNLPFTCISGNGFYGVDRIGGTTGNQCAGVVGANTNSSTMWTYNNGYPWATNATGNFTVTYFTS